MPVPSPRNAMEASRLIRSTEAAARLDPLDVWLYAAPGPGLRFELESSKTDEHGQRTSNRYMVDMLEFTCTCPDFQARGSFCKHLIYVEAVCRRAEEEAASQGRQAEDQEDGRLYMENLHIERSLAC